MNQPQETTPAPVATESVPESPQDDSNSTLSHTVISIAQDLSFNADTFGPRVVKVNRDKGLLFGPVLPNDFTKEFAFLLFKSLDVDMMPTQCLSP